MHLGLDSAERVVVLLRHGDLPARLLLGQLLLEPLAENSAEEPSLCVRVVREEDSLSLADGGEHLMLAVSFSSGH